MRHPCPSEDEFGLRRVVPAGAGDQAVSESGLQVDRDDVLAVLGRRQGEEVKGLVGMVREVVAGGCRRAG